MLNNFGGIWKKNKYRYNNIVICMIVMRKFRMLKVKRRIDG